MAPSGQMPVGRLLPAPGGVVLGFLGESCCAFAAQMQLSVAGAAIAMDWDIRMTGLTGMVSRPVPAANSKRRI